MDQLPARTPRRPSRLVATVLFILSIVQFDLALGNPDELRVLIIPAAACLIFSLLRIILLIFRGRL